MPTPVSLARQCLTEEAARALDEAVGVARRRSHSQTTSLHAVSALLALPSSTLREACARARSIAYNSRLQFRALELCVGVSLDRLPSSKTAEDPPISNSLMAAIKRSQANQRRNPENYHLQQIHCNQQTASLLKVELKYFILSILDDPIVSRVFGEAGFRSCDIKLAIIHPPVTQISPKFPRTPRCPPIFLCNLADSGLGLSSDSIRSGPSLPFGFEDVDENCRRIGEVLVKRNEKNGRNPLLVGVCASNALKGFIENVTSGKLGVLPKQIYGLDVICIEREISMFVVESGSEEFMALRLKELENAVEQCTGPGVVINVGELKALVGDPVSNEAVKFVVSKLTSLLEMHSGKLWLIGAAANYDTYLKFSNIFPNIEKDWDLHLLPIHSKSSLMGSFVPFGGFFSSPLDFKSPIRSKNQYSSCCYLCTEKFEREVAAILKEGSTTSVADQCSEKLPSWLQMAELDTRKDADMAKTKEDGTMLNAKVLELQKKWNDICQRLHHTQIFSKLDIPETRSHVPISEVFHFIADMKESSSKDPSSDENLCAHPNPGMHIDSQKVLPPIQNTVALNSEAENFNSQSSLQVNISKNQVENVGHPFPPYPLPDVTKPSHHSSSSSPIAVTTDLGLGTIYSSTRQEAETPKLKDQSLARDISPESTSYHDTKCSCSATSIGEQMDPRDYKKLKKILAEKVGWQDEAICTISQTIIHCRNGCGRHRRSNCKGNIWLTFLGPDRVGKKKIASALAEVMFGNEENIIAVDFLSSQDRVIHPESIFDCQELDGSDVRFWGKNVVDYVAGELRKKPLSVIFLENVDKADSVAQDRLSRAIKTGRFPDSHGREISINNVIFVTTSRITKGNHNVISEGKVVKFSEEKILGAKSWQLQMLISCHSEDVHRTHDLNANFTPREEISHFESMNKRKLIDIGESSDELQKWGHKSLRSYLDLNIPIDEAEEEHHSQDYDSDAISEGTEAWLEEFFDLVDKKVVFKPCNFDALAEKLTKEIRIRFERTMGSDVLLEIDDEVMIQILAASWLSNRRRAIEGWVESVLGRSFSEFQQKYHPAAGSVVKLVACEGLVVKEQAPGLRLPTKINV